jgi:hypothetical protein
MNCSDAGTRWRLRALHAIEASSVYSPRDWAVFCSSLDAAHGSINIHAIIAHSSKWTDPAASAKLLLILHQVPLTRFGAPVYNANGPSESSYGRHGGIPDKELHRHPRHCVNAHTCVLMLHARGVCFCACVWVGDWGGADACACACVCKGSCCCVHVCACEWIAPTEDNH